MRDEGFLGSELAFVRGFQGQLPDDIVHDLELVALFDVDVTVVVIEVIGVCDDFGTFCDHAIMIGDLAWYGTLLSPSSLVIISTLLSFFLGKS